MRRLRRIVPALGAAALIVPAVAACGGDSVPGDSVARVGDQTIKKSTYDHWVEVAALSSASQTDPTAAQKGVKPKVSIPDSPDFKNCIATKKKAAPKPVKGQAPVTDATYKSQCQTEYTTLRDQAMQFLVSASWIDQESSDRDVSVKDAEVNKQFETTKKQSFPKEADFNNFLKSSGMTKEDLLFRVKVDALSTKLRTAITKGKDKVSAAEIKTYYDKNKTTQFAQPEKRDLSIVLTKTKAKAEEAKSALEGGDSFKTVAKKYSIDPATKDASGKLAQVAKGQQEKSLDTAVFKASKGKLTGPIKTQFGYYVFEVDKITKPIQQTLAQSTATIKQLLASQKQQKALDEFVDDFRDKWQDKTNCAKGYVIADCKNAPKPKTGTTTTPTPTTGS